MTRSMNARLAGFGYLSYIVVGILNEVLMYRATIVFKRLPRSVR